jgi:hypothetical protein
MLYDRVGGTIRPFHEDQKNYMFRYFCSDNLIPVQQSFPKSQPHHLCECKTLMFIEKDSKGPWLRFQEAAQRHFAAKLRS